jgi:hypothetical protein
MCVFVLGKGVLQLLRLDLSLSQITLKPHTCYQAIISETDARCNAHYQSIMGFP